MRIFKVKYRLKRDNRKLYWALPLFLFFLGIPKLGNTLPSKNLESILSQLEKHVLNQIQKKQIAGCAIAIVYRNEVVFLRGYGVKSMGRNEKIDPDTVFQLGSVSKPVAATLASVLEHKGLLRLEDPVNYYLPDFSLKSSQSPSNLRIKHVLSHSTGVPRAGFNDLIESHASYNRILQSLKSTPVRSTVGKRYDYHNAMFSLISEITTAATRLPFKDALKQNLLIPLNMTRTSTTLAGLLNTPNRAIPHTRGRRGALVPCDTYTKGYYTVAPAGGINSSIKDMAIFLKAQMGGYPLVLNRSILSRIHAPHVTTKPSLSTFEGSPQLIKNARYGLGWRIVDFDNHKLIFHGGWVKGFTNFIAFIPEKEVGIVVLQNAENKFSSKTAMKFLELFMDVPKRRGSSLVPKKKLIPILQKKMTKPLKQKRSPLRKPILNRASVEKRSPTKKSALSR